MSARDRQQTANDDGSSSLPAVLSSLASSPRAFIVGAVLTTLLEAITNLVTELLNAVLLVLAGSDVDRFNAPGEQLGLADLPVAFADVLIGAGDVAGSGILDAIRTVNDPLFSLASSGGAAAPLIVTGIVAIEVVVVLAILRLALRVALDFIPGGGAIADYL